MKPFAVFILLLSFLGPAWAQSTTEQPQAAKVYFAAYRTRAHIGRSQTSVFVGVTDSLMEFLQSNNVALVKGPVTQVKIRVKTLVKQARQAGAESLVYVTVDRPFTAWIKVTVECFDDSGKLLWKETSSDKWSMRGKGGTRKSLAKLEAKLTEKLGGPGLEVSAAGARPQAAGTRAQAEVPAAARTFHAQVIGTITAGSSFKGIRISGAHVAWVEEFAGKQTVRLDGKVQGGTYDEISHARFSPGARHFVFFGKRGSSWVLVFDGREQPGQYDKVSGVAFPPQGDSYAFVACQAKKCQLNVDGTMSGPVYDDFSSPRYSNDGKKLAFLGKRDGMWFAVVSGKELGPGMKDAWPLFWGFADDGSRFYVAGRLDGKWTYIVDGKPGPDFDVISPIAFSPDGRHYAYGGTVVKAGALKKKTIGTIVVDGKPGETYEGSGMAGALSLVGGTWEHMSGGVHYLNADFHGVSTPQFNSTGKIAYAVRRGKGKVVVMVGDESGPAFHNIVSPIVFSRDSRQVIYIAAYKGELQEVRNHKVVRNFLPGKGKRPATLVPWVQMSPDGSHLAYEIVRGGMQYSQGATNRALRSVVLDGKAGPEYDAKGIGYFDATRDGKHYLYEVVGASGDKDLVNVDGLESSLYDEAWAPHFSGDEKEAVFIARQDRRLLRVTLPLD